MDFLSDNENEKDLFMINVLVFSNDFKFFISLFISSFCSYKIISFSSLFPKFNLNIKLIFLLMFISLIYTLFFSKKLSKYENISSFALFWLSLKIMLQKLRLIFHQIYKPHFDFIFLIN